MTTWKHDVPSVPVPIVAGEFYRTRGGLTAFVMREMVIAPADSSTHPTWYGWRGYIVETGDKCAWFYTGDYSPVAHHDWDIVDVAGN